ncbi:uncharacterized protein LOC126882821 isoform X2 [Diabrotica virgifera virgifera]|uniref:Uncharacterized protein n=1 Tax=Diabrotica virgifera virgifera TaxID=50390 RepID=A0ABM5K105_DIAVI|nr:uncharacterized protein LOC126882821 isoform X2 [Diabrotica virgifera virgifera]
MDNGKNYTPTSGGKNVFQEVKYSPIAFYGDQSRDEIKRPDTLYLYFTIMTVIIDGFDG